MDNCPSVCPVVHLLNHLPEFKFHPRSFNSKQEVNYIVHLVQRIHKKAFTRLDDSTHSHHFYLYRFSNAGYKSYIISTLKELIILQYQLNYK